MPGKAETLAETAIRELEEETSMVAKGLDFAFQIIGATTVHHVFVAILGKVAIAKAEPRDSALSMGHAIRPAWEWDSCQYHDTLR